MFGRSNLIWYLCFLLAALYNDYADEDIPDLAPSDLTTNEEPAEEPSVSPSPCPVPPPNDVMRPGSLSPSPGPLPRRGRAIHHPVNVTQLMHLAGGLGIAAEIAAADSQTDSFGPDWEVPSECAGYDRYEGRRIGTSAMLRK